MEENLFGDFQITEIVSNNNKILVLSNGIIKQIALGNLKIFFKESIGEDSDNLIIESFIANKTSPQNLGSTITLTVNAIGGSGNLLYRFREEDKIIKEYSESNSANWNPSTIGNKKLYVDVKDSNNRIVTTYINFQINETSEGGSEGSGEGSGEGGGETPSPLDLTATKLVNNITAGWNLGGTFECSGSLVRDSAKNRTYDEGVDYETWWGNPLTTKELIKAIKAKGFNAIRVPITWVHHFIFDSSGNITISAPFLNRVKEVVGWILDEGMYCIINTHHDDANYGEGQSEANAIRNPWSMTYPLQWLHADDKVSNPEVKETYEEIERRFKQVWTVIANEFKSFNTNLVFEGYNEIQGWRRNWADPTPAQLNNANKLNQAFVDTVRATGGNNAKRILCVQTYGGYETSRMGNFKLPNDTVEDRLIVQVHLYTNFSGEQAKNLFSYINSNFTQRNIPIIIGEFGLSVSGGVEKEVDGARIVKNVTAIAKSYKAKVFWWDTDDFTNKSTTWYGLINRTTLEWVRPLLANAIMEGLTADPNDDGYAKEIKLTSWDDYLYKSICNNLDATNYNTTDVKELGRYYPTNEGHFSPYKLFTCKSADSIKMAANNSSGNGWRIDKYAYYDKDFKLIETIGASSTPISLATTVPSNTNIKYVGFSAFNPWQNTSESSLRSYIESGSLYLSFATTNAECTQVIPSFPTQVNCTEININPSYISFNGSETKKIITSLSPASTTNNLRYKSENTFVATVNEIGEVSSTGNGNTNIIIECGNISKVCNVNVTGLGTKIIEIKSIDGLEFGKLNESDGSIIPNSNEKPGWVTTKYINVENGTKFFLQSYMNNNSSTPAVIRIQSWAFYDINNNFISSGKLLLPNGNLNTSPDTGTKGVVIPSNASKFKVCLFNPWGAEVFQPAWYQTKFEQGWSIRINSDGFLTIG